MSRRIAILAALPRELQPLVKGWQRRNAAKYVSLWTHISALGDELIAACAGMGADAARQAFAAAEQGEMLDMVLSVGLAGATVAGALPIGSVKEVSEIVDVATGERFVLSQGEHKVRLATVQRTAHAAEKRRLANSYAVALVDMEAATIARLAAMRALPMYCFKAVSDAADAVLPELDAFIDRHGQLRTGRFAANVILHPRYWRATVALARTSTVAAQNLGSELRAFLEDEDRLRRTT